MQPVSVFAHAAHERAGSPVTATAARLLLYLALMLAIGDVGAQWAQGARWRARAEAITRRAMLAWLAALAALLTLFVAQFVALELSPTVDEVAMLARQTAWGRGWLTLAGCAVTGAVLTLARATLALRLVVALAMAIAMGGLGHAAADDVQWLSRTIDATHVMAVGLWLGTLWCLRNATTADWSRLSAIATIGAPLAVASGVGSALRRVGGASLGQIIDSDYGRLLVLKLAIVVIILALGARHRRDVRAHRAPGPASVRTELMLAFATLAVTAVLTGTAPPGE